MHNCFEFSSDTINALSIVPDFYIRKNKISDIISGNFEELWKQVGDFIPQIYLKAGDKDYNLIGNLVDYTDFPVIKPENKFAGFAYE